VDSKAECDQLNLAHVTRHCIPVLFIIYHVRENYRCRTYVTLL